MKTFIKGATLSASITLVALQAGAAEDASQQGVLPAFGSVDEQLEEAMRLFYESDPSNWYGGIEPDTKAERALELFLPLARSGCAQAQYMMARQYELADDDERAAEWARRAAEQGHAGGQFALATLLEWYGESADALKWHRRAAEQGVVLSISRISSYYQTGQVVESDNVQAYKWQLLTLPRLPPADSDYEAPGSGIDTHREILREYEWEMTETEIRRAERLAEQWEEEHDSVRHFPDNPEKPYRAWYARVDGGCNR